MTKIEHGLSPQTLGKHKPTTQNYVVSSTRERNRLGRRKAGEQDIHKGKRDLATMI